MSTTKRILGLAFLVCVWGSPQCGPRTYAQQNNAVVKANQEFIDSIKKGDLAKVRELLPRRQRRVRRIAGMAHINLQKTIAAGKGVCAKVKLHRKHTVGYLHARVGNDLGRTLQSARAHSCGVVQAELQIKDGIGGRRAVISQAALIGES